MNRILLPIAFLYQGLLACRHKLYDWHILRSRKYDVPVICVGNLALGGTGKTPHIEYLIRLLSDPYSICVVSRGYGRKTKGFQLVTSSSSADTVGDEPLQLFSKFKDLQVAVDESRCEAIELVNSQEMPPQLYLLDDAFQHRRINAGLNLLLTSYGKPFCEDHLIPAGTLRDIRSAAKRADVVIVTQCPENLFDNPEEDINTEINLLRQRLHLENRQQLFLSSVRYEALRPVTQAAKTLFSNKGHQLSPETACLCFTGIAHPEPLLEQLESNFSDVQAIRFADHHRYKKKDVQALLDRFKETAHDNRILVTTEKDVARLINSPYFCQFESVPLFVAPISISIHQEEKFNNIILNYVRENYNNC